MEENSSTPKAQEKTWAELTPKEKKMQAVKRICSLLFPIALAFLLFLFFYFVLSPEDRSGGVSSEFIVFVALMIVYIVPPFGKETIIPAALLGGGAVTNLVANITHLPADIAVGGYPLWTVAMGIIGLDLIMSLFISFNFDLLLKIPLIGRWFCWIMRSADKILHKKKWIEDLSSAGLLIFMYIPLQGSGAMTTSIIARILNYNPVQTVGLVTIGSILSTLTVSLGVSSIIQLRQISPVLAILEGASILAVIILIAVFWSKLSRKLTERAERKKALKEQILQQN